MNLLQWLLNCPPVSPLLLRSLLDGVQCRYPGVIAPVIDQINPDEAIVEASNVSVHLNDEVMMPDMENGTVTTSIVSGTPGDYLTVVPTFSPKPPWKIVRTQTMMLKL